MMAANALSAPPGSVNRRSGSRLAAARRSAPTRARALISRRSPHRFQRVCEVGDGGRELADLDQTDAHKDLREPVRDLLEVRVGEVARPVVRARGLALQRARDLEQEPENRADHCRCGGDRDGGREHAEKARRMVGGRREAEGREREAGRSGERPEEDAFVERVESSLVSTGRPALGRRIRHRRPPARPDDTGPPAASTWRPPHVQPTRTTPAG